MPKRNGATGDWPPPPKRGDHHDELDRQRALRFAWRVAPPGQIAKLSAEDVEDASAPASVASASTGESEKDGGVRGEPTAAPDPSAAHVAEQLRREAAADCSELAGRIDFAWALPFCELQAVATARLARRANALSLRLCALSPLPSVRLARLFVRHFARLPHAAKTAASDACLWLQLTHPETTDLLVEIAEAGNLKLALRLFMEEDSLELVPCREDLGVRLGRILDGDATNPSSCVIALDWLAVFGASGAVPAVRRALRARHLGVRARALQILLEDPAEPLSVADVLFLLDDLLAHPPPVRDLFADSDDEDSEEARRTYADGLVAAVRRLRPAGGDDLLERLASDESELVDDEDLGAGWAIQALAAGYAERALPFIDYALGVASVGKRIEAMNAIAELDVKDARARLLVAMDDGAAEVAQRARAIWEEKTGEAPPAPSDAWWRPVTDDGDERAERGKEEAYDRGTDRFLARLIVLRGERSEARHRLARVLLKAAPDREALALLTFALADDQLWRSYSATGLPNGLKSWSKLLLRRFGAPAIGSLCALAARFPYRWTEDWFEVLGSLLRDGTIRVRDSAPIRAMAVRHVASDDWVRETAAIAILRKTGIPSELVERMWSIAITDDEWEPGRVDAAAILTAWRDAGELDRALVAEMDRAFAARDFQHLTRAAAIAFGRKARAAIGAAEKILEQADVQGTSEESCVEALVTCARGLRDVGRLSGDWIDDALAHPESRRFATATRMLGLDPAPSLSASQRRALVRALASPARGGAASAEAASALVVARRRVPRDVLEAILARAPLRARVDLIARLCDLGSHPSLVARNLPALLTTTDIEVSAAMADAISAFQGFKRVLRDALPRVADSGLRAAIELYVDRIPADAADEYWQA